MALKKPEIKTIQYLDWFNVEHYLFEKYKHTNIKEACYQVRAGAEVGNDSYTGRIRVDIDDYWKPSIHEKLFCELFNKEYPDLDKIVFWICW